MISYVLTQAGWIAALPRRAECGHFLCNGRPDCLLGASPQDNR